MLFTHKFVIGKGEIVIESILPMVKLIYILFQRTVNDEQGNINIQKSLFQKALGRTFKSRNNSQAAFQSESIKPFIAALQT